MDNSDIKLSIIIPFYNEFHYLPKAVQSSNQVSKVPFEILVINDNPDEITDADFAPLPLPGPVRIVHHPHNKGLQAARNTGMREARGEYILFLDSDDYFLPDTLDDLMEFVETHKADMTHFMSYQSLTTSRHLKMIKWDRDKFGEERVLHGRDIALEGTYSLSTWSCVYRNDFIREFDLYGDEEQRRFEDRLFVMQTMLRARALAVYPHPIRVWSRRMNSITTSANDVASLTLKTKSLCKILATIADSDHDPDTRHALLVNDLGILLSQIVSGGTDFAYQDLYFGPDTAPMQELRQKIADVIAPLRTPDLDAETVESARNRHHRVRRKFDAGKMLAVFDALASADAAKVREITTQAYPKITKSRRVPIDPAAPFGPLLKGAENGVDYVIHVGTHKTGTTSIQTTLKVNRDVLAQNGLLFAKTGFGGAAAFKSVKAGGVPGHDALWKALRENDQEKLSALKTEIDASGCDKVLISAENMSGSIYGSTDKANFAKLAEALSRLPNRRSVTFVVYFRNPLTWLDSYYREVLAAGFGIALRANSPDEFLSDNIHFVDYADYVAGLKTISGREVLVGDFEAAKKSDLMADFLEKVVPGQGASLAATLDTATSHTYEGLCNAQVEALHYIKAFSQNSDVYKLVAREFLSRIGKTEARGILFSPVHQRRVLSRFIAKNGDFANEYGLNALMESAKTMQAGAGSDPITLPQHYSTMLFDVMSPKTIRDGHADLDDTFVRTLEVNRLSGKGSPQRILSGLLGVFFALRRGLMALGQLVRQERSVTSKARR